MNQSIIVTRYARSLVKLVGETGRGGAVCQEAEQLVKSLQELPELQRMITAADDVVPPSGRRNCCRRPLEAKCRRIWANSWPC